ncbi:MAG: SUMF1/EgtB/PvdO family nonheme iron enzyme [Planctomycetaceae bacterium]|nr:SUMF1/EgtB/PvdO family nonheme iron enzyme [Planctomycetaceae bacterium]
MLRFTFLSCLALAASHSSPAFAEGRKLALLVGVEKYQHAKLDDLKFCGDDVQALERLLTPQGFRCVVLRNDSNPNAAQLPEAALPTAANVNSELRRMLEGINKQDLILVVLTGHGLQPAGDSQPYFCPEDANPVVNMNANGGQKLARPESLIGIGTLLTQLDQSGVGHKLVLVDACRNAPQLKGMKSGVDRIAFQLPDQCGLLLSCSQGQFSFESEKLGSSGRGVFLHHVIDGLEGAAQDDDGIVTWDSLVAHVRRTIPKTMAKVFGPDVNARQTPHQIANLEGTPVLATRVNLPPPLFDATKGKTAAEAKAAQDAWAKHLKTSVEIENSIGMRMTLLPPGTYKRGSTPADIDAVVSLDATFKKESSDDEQPQHTVRLTKAFRLGTTEVTRGQFRRFVNATGYVTEAEKDDGGYGYNVAEGKFEGRDKKYHWRNTGFAQTDEHPVVNVTWNDAKAFVDWLSKEEGKEYRLPTESEWEYACRAGTTGMFSGGNTFDVLDGIANIGERSTRQIKGYDQSYSYSGFDDGYQFTVPAGEFRANVFGLSDMHGNVWEWCGDGYDAKEYAKHAGGIVEDPKGPSAETSSRVMRGGSWDVTPGYCRSASRFSYSPGDRRNHLGFRVLTVQSFR